MISWSRLPRALVLIAGFMSLWSASSANALSYTLTVLGTLESDSTGVSGGTGINNAGLVVGYADRDGAPHVFRWTSADGMTDVGQVVPGFSSDASDVNNGGQLCGFGYTQSNGFAQALYQSPGDGLTVLPSQSGAGDWYGYGISDGGVVVGWTNFFAGCGSYLCTGNPGHAIEWVSPDSPHLLPDLGGYFSVAFGISSDGTKICGAGATPSGDIRGFRLRGTDIDLLPPLDGFTEAWPQGINDLGDVVGFSKAGNAMKATLWTGTTAHDLGLPAGAVSSIAVGINDPGQIVGYSIVSGDSTRAVLFSPSTSPQDLNDLIAPGSGVTLTYADDINDAGAIVGYARGASQRAMVLTPEPATAVESPLVAPGLALSAPWPNPANGGASLQYVLSSSGPTRLTVVDVAGRVVTTLVDRAQPAGVHSFPWDGRDSEGRLLAPGTYFVRIQSGSDSQSQKLVVVR